MVSIVVHTAKKQLKAIKAFLKALKAPFEEIKEEKLSQHIIDGISKGIEDIKAGRSMTLDQFSEWISLHK